MDLVTAGPVMTALCGFFGLPVLKDLTTRQWDVRVDTPYISDGVNGSSSGALAALALLQATSNCVFHGEVSSVHVLHSTHGQSPSVDAAVIVVQYFIVAPERAVQLSSYGTVLRALPGGYDGRAEPQWADVACGWSR
jgi:hypothetical protein